jgi:hypothetical protein
VDARIVLLLALTPPVGAQTLVMESRLQRTEGWEARIEMKEEGRLRVVGLAVYERAALERAAAGIETAWLAAGPLAPEGLLRLVDGPLDSGPSAEVYTQETALSLDGSFDGGSRSGVIAWPMPGRLGVGALARDGSVTALAVAGGRPLPALRWEALGARSAPPADPPGDAWFAEGPPWPGGPLAHAALRAALETGGVEAAAAAGMSAAERAPPGGWALLRLHGHRGGARGDLLLGLADGEARDTAGSLLRPLRRAALRAEARAAGLRAWAEGSACRGPGALAASWGAATPRLGLEGGLRARRGEALSWEACLRLDGKRLDAEVRRAGSGRLSAEARLQAGALELGADCCWDEGRLGELEIRLGSRKPGLAADLAAGWSARDDRPWVSLGWRATRRLR